MSDASNVPHPPVPGTPQQPGPAPQPGFAPPGPGTPAGQPQGQAPDAPWWAKPMGYADPRWTPPAVHAILVLFIALFWLLPGALLAVLEVAPAAKAANAVLWAGLCLAAIVLGWRARRSGLAALAARGLADPRSPAAPGPTATRAGWVGLVAMVVGTILLIACVGFVLGGLFIWS